MTQEPHYTGVRELDAAAELAWLRIRLGLDTTELAHELLDQLVGEQEAVAMLRLGEQIVGASRLPATPRPC